MLAVVMVLFFVMAGIGAAADVDVYKSGGYIYAKNSLTGATIASGASPANDDSVLQTACNQGGTIFVHPGTYQDISITSTNVFTLVGAGRYNTILMKPTGSTCLDLDHSMITVENIQIKGDANNADSSGYAIDLKYDSTDTNINNVYITDVKSGIYHSGGGCVGQTTIISGPAGGDAIVVNGTNQLWNQIVVAGNYNGGSPLRFAHGCHIQRTGGVWFENADFWNCAIGTHIVPPSGAEANAIFFSGSCLGDFSGTYGMQIAGDGLVTDVHISNSWFGSTGDKGMLIQNEDALVMIDNSVVFCAPDQLIHITAAKLFSMSNSYVACPGWGNSGGYTTWVMADSCDDLIMHGNTFHENWYTQSGDVDCGFYITNCGNVVLTSNILRDATTNLFSAGNVAVEKGHNIPAI